MTAPSTSPSAQETVFLVDGNAIAYRSHFAFVRNPLLTESGEDVSAIFGFANSLLRIIEVESPALLAVVFDPRGKTFRHERFPEYKATREKMPEELVGQLDGIHRLLEVLNIPDLVMDGVEADDVIGTLTLRAVQSGYDVRIVSGDKDFCQLVDSQVQLYSPGKQGAAADIVDCGAVETRFGVRPDQVIDLLALMGDKSDNVPGVARIGGKTAAALLQQFGSIDRLYERLEEVAKPSVRRYLEEGRESAVLSRELVTIRTDLKLETEIEDLRRREPDAERTRELFVQYGFRTLLPRVPQGAVPPPPQNAVETDYRLIQGDEALSQLVAELRKAGRFALDTETTGLDPRRAELVGISVSTAPGQAAYVPMLAGRGLFGQGASVPFGKSLDELRELLADPKVEKAGQNIKYDLHVLERAGLPVAGVAFDTMLAHYCVEPSAPQHGLDALSLEFFGHTKIKTSELLGRGKQQITMAEVPLEALCEYACEDADYTWRLVEVMENLLRERHVDELYRDLELPLLHVLQRMEAAGVALDIAQLKEMSREFEARAAELEEIIYREAGEPFNIQSTRQLGEILYVKLELPQKLGIKKIPKTKTGYSTNAQALQLLEGHPLVDAILEYRQLEKLRSTYLDTLPKLVNPETGRIHTSFNQSVAATGRLSSSDPNLQNIPIRTTLGRRIRAAFRSSFDNGSIISADYSQVELRILAHLAQDDHLCAAFRDGEDVHRRTAALIFKVDPEAVDSEMRTRAKAINFGIIYGMGAPRLALETGLTMKEASQFIQRYFEVFAGVKTFLDGSVEKAREQGYVTTLLGRQRAIPELYSSDRRVAANARNIAVNTPIQGTAADLIKRAMIDVDRRLEASSLESRMVLQVHDELVFDVAAGEGDAIRELAVDCMENALTLSIPLKVDVGEGLSWLDAH